MAFRREIKTQYYSESDNVWIDNPFKETDGKDNIQIVGTQVQCIITDEETALLRSTSFLVPPHIAIEDKESQELIELHFDMCEHSLKRDLKKRLKANIETELIANEFRANNIT